MTATDPIKQIGTVMRAAKAQGLSFNEAWEIAIDEVTWPKSAEERLTARAAIRATKAAWATIWRDEPEPRSDRVENLRALWQD